MKKIFFAIPIVVLVAAGCNHAQQVATVSTPTAPVQAVSSSQPNSTLPQVQSKQVGDLHLFSFDTKATDTRYYQVSSLVVNGNPLIVASTYGNCDGVGCSPEYFRFSQNVTGYVLLTKYSGAVGSNQNVSQKDLLVTASSAQDVPALDIPATLTDPTSKAVVTYDGKTLLEGSIFDSSLGALLFTANGYPVYSYSGKNIETFFTESADGKELVYNLTSSTIGKVLWSTGAASQVTYVLDGACTGLTAYRDALAKTVVSQSDLTAIGTMGGTPVYELSNSQNQLLVGLKADHEDFNKMQIKANGGTSDGSNGTTLVLYPPVTRTTILFWSDPFGRLIRLIDSTQFSDCIN